MTDRAPPASPKPLARLEFATRLRELRASRGFRTARGLARALDIDENRYTRYERAEVEPDLELFLRICRVLNSTPNELLGFGPIPRRSGDAHPTAGPTGLPEPPASEFLSTGPHAIALQAIAWQLCSRVVKLRQDRAAHQAAARAGRPAKPLDALDLVAELHQELKVQPFEVIRQIVRDLAVVEASVDAARDIHDLILQLTQGIAQIATQPPAS